MESPKNIDKAKYGESPKPKSTPTSPTPDSSRHGVTGGGKPSYESERKEQQKFNGKQNPENIRPSGTSGEI